MISICLIGFTWEIRIRNRLSKKAQKSNKLCDLLKFRKARNKANNMKKYAINNSYNNIELNLAETSKNNTKLFRKPLKDLFSVKSRTVIPPLVYSSKIKTKYKCWIIISLRFHFLMIMEFNYQIRFLYVIDISDVDNIVIREQDIIDIITILPSNKAIGTDTRSHKILKSTIYTIVRYLCLLFNRSLNIRLHISLLKENSKCTSFI